MAAGRAPPALRRLDQPGRRRPGHGGQEGLPRGDRPAVPGGLHWRARTSRGAARTEATFTGRSTSPTSINSSGMVGNVVRMLAPHAPVYCWHAHKRQADMWQDLDLLNTSRSSGPSRRPCSGGASGTSGTSRASWGGPRGACRRSAGTGAGVTGRCGRSTGRARHGWWATRTRPRSRSGCSRCRCGGTRNPATCASSLFPGTGASSFAATQQGRRCYAIELEPAFVAVTLERLAGMGLEPHLADG